MRSRIHQNNLKSKRFEYSFSLRTSTSNKILITINAMTLNSRPWQEYPTRHKRRDVLYVVPRVQGA